MSCNSKRRFSYYLTDMEFFWVCLKRAFRQLIVIFLVIQYIWIDKHFRFMKQLYFSPICKSESYKNLGVPTL